jgi:hypothetical protein
MLALEAVPDPPQNLAVDIRPIDNVANPIASAVSGEAANCVERHRRHNDRQRCLDDRHIRDKLGDQTFDQSRCDCQRHRKLRFDAARLGAREYAKSLIG